MKRIFLLLSLLCCLALAGCGQSKTAAEQAPLQPVGDTPSSVSPTFLHHSSGELDLWLGMTQQQV